VTERYDDDPATAAAIRVVALQTSLGKLDGGGRRVAAFLDAVKATQGEPNVTGIGPLGTEALQHAVDSRLHRIKRRALPIPLRRNVERDLVSVSSAERTVSLIPSAHRWALESRCSWLDYPDLWSEFAKHHARHTDWLSGAVSSAQRAIWKRREQHESSQASAVSVASWSDQRRLGRDAIWLPTPIVKSAEDLDTRRQRTSTPGEPVYGFLGNFNYPPNRDAYERLVREWTPVLQPIAGRIVVAGFDSAALPRCPGVDLLGEVADLRDFYETIDVALAPIEKGGGMKVKIVEAMMHGVPVLATEHALEGLPPALRAVCSEWRGFKAAPLHDHDPDRFRDPRLHLESSVELKRFTTESFVEVFAQAFARTMVPTNP
jgi:glycosyltransferase involved in cell wall biosynthesis